MRRLILQRSQALGVHIIDTRNCFYLYQVDGSGWHTQVIGPRIPASWLHHIDDDTCDDVNNDDLENWWEPDLRQSSDDAEPHVGYRQMAIVGVMMGDTNAISVLEMAHRRQLINAGVLRTESLLLPERPLPQGTEFGDVFIDDLVLFSILHFSRLNELERCPRAACERGMYEQLSMPTAHGKENAGLRAEFWSGSHDGIAGTLGFPMCRRTSLMYVTLAGTVLKITRTTLQQLLGAWNFALSFRREALCCLDVAFLAARTLRTRRPIPPTGALLGLFAPGVRRRAFVAGRSEGVKAARAFSYRRQPFLCWSVCGPCAWKPVADTPQSRRRTGTHAVAVRMCCGRHSGRLVCAVWASLMKHSAIRWARRQII